MMTLKMWLPICIYLRVMRIVQMEHILTRRRLDSRLCIHSHWLPSCPGTALLFSSILIACILVGAK